MKDCGWGRHSVFEGVEGTHGGLHYLLWEESATANIDKVLGQGS